MSHVSLYASIAFLALAVVWFFLARPKREEVRAVPSRPPANPAPVATPEVRPLVTTPEPAVAAPVVDVTPPEDTAIDLGPEGPVPRVQLHAVGATHPGKNRSHNEDAFVILEDAHVFVVADGMGRHAAGEVASQLCVDVMREAYRREGDVGPRVDPPLPRRGAQMRNAILEANAKVLQLANENDAYAGMGTTVVSACFSPYSQRTFIAHVGDSRCYRLRGDTIVQLTADHTLGAVGFTGKRAGFLSRAVGVEEVVEVEVDVERSEPEDVYLLCSDGLTRMVDDDQILATVHKAGGDLESAVSELVALANERGGRDNITAILVKVQAAPPA